MKNCWQEIWSIVIIINNTVKVTLKEKKLFATSNAHTNHSFNLYNTILSPIFPFIRKMIIALSSLFNSQTPHQQQKQLCTCNRLCVKKFWIIYIPISDQDYFCPSFIQIFNCTQCITSWLSLLLGLFLDQNVWIKSNHDNFGRKFCLRKFSKCLYMRKVI